MVNTENSLGASAVAELYVQVERFDKKSVADYTHGSFYDALVHLRHPNLRVHQIREGSDKGKLTLERKVDGNWELDQRITPVDCYNLQRDGESLATAVKRIFH